LFFPKQNFHIYLKYENQATLNIGILFLYL
jgi:hypothetical protein